MFEDPTLNNSNKAGNNQFNQFQNMNDSSNFEINNDINNLKNANHDQYLGMESNNIKEKTKGSSFSNSPNSPFNGKTVPIKPILLFAIVLILIIIILVGIFINIRKKQNQEKTVNTRIASSDPIIQVKANEDNSKLDIKVVHTENLDKIAYSWNDEASTERVVSAGRNKEFTIKDIEIPLGTNTLTVIAKDEGGVEGKYKNDFTNNLGEDIGKPKINLSLDKRGKNIKVNVKDNESLKKVSYKWNDGDEHQVELQEKSQNEVSFNVKIIPGKNTFNVYAEDNNGNITKRQKNYEGIEAPTLNFRATPDGKSVILKVFHPIGVKSIEYKLNGEVFKSDDIKGNLTTVEVTINLTQENNEIEAKASSVDGVTSHPEIRSVKMQKRQELDEFGERVQDEAQNRNAEE